MKNWLRRTNMPAWVLSSATDLLTKFHDLLDTSKMTPSTMQLLTDFVEHVYFPAKKASGALKA